MILLRGRARKTRRRIIALIALIIDYTIVALILMITGLLAR